jgi:hypothetical protein
MIAGEREKEREKERDSRSDKSFFSQFKINKQPTPLCYMYLCHDNACR